MVHSASSAALMPYDAAIGVRRRRRKLTGPGDGNPSAERTLSACEEDVKMLAWEARKVEWNSDAPCLSQRLPSSPTSLKTPSPPTPSPCAQGEGAHCSVELAPFSPRMERRVGDEGSPG